MELYDSLRAIEAWRLLKRLVAISKQHHGPKHNITKDLERQLLQCKTAYVGVLGRGLFEVLLHESDKYVVRGPTDVIEEKRKQSELMKHTSQYNRTVLQYFAMGSRTKQLI
jgi:hypothetical protein